MVENRRFYESRVGADARRFAPAAQRNREPITAILSEWLPACGLVLEVASGTGEHVVQFARAFPKLDWQPSDLHPDSLASIAAWRDDSGFTNIHAPILIDASAADWPIARADAVLSINMMHISPWAAALGLIAGAARLLDQGAPLILYGPWRRANVEPASSNLAFDADLRRRDSAWGLRVVEDIAAAASLHFDLIDTNVMPANNLMLLFQRSGAGR